MKNKLKVFVGSLTILISLSAFVVSPPYSPPAGSPCEIYLFEMNYMWKYAGECLWNGQLGSSIYSCDLNHQGYCEVYDCDEENDACQFLAN